LLEAGQINVFKLGSLITPTDSSVVSLLKMKTKQCSEQLAEIFCHVSTLCEQSASSLNQIHRKRHRSSSPLKSTLSTDSDSNSIFQTAVSNNFCNWLRENSENVALAPPKLEPIQVKDEPKPELRTTPECPSFSDGALQNAVGTRKPSSDDLDLLVRIAELIFEMQQKVPNKKHWSDPA